MDSAGIESIASSGMAITSSVFWEMDFLAASQAFFDAKSISGAVLPSS